MKENNSRPNVKTQRVTLGTMTIDVKPKPKRGFPKWAIILVCAAAVVLAAITLYAFVFSGEPEQQAAAPAPTRTETPAPTQTPVAPTQTPDPTPTQTEAPSPTPEPTPSTMWGAKFPGKFTDAEVIQEGNSYMSPHINVSVEKVQKDKVTYYVADIYITDIEYFKTGLAKDKFGSSQTTDKQARNKNAVIAINGDYCTYNKGLVVRNGEVYRSKVYHRDILVMYNDGTMETYQKGEYDSKEILAKNPYQIWTFGPQLLQDGQPMSKFNSSVTKRNPRTAIGYYEPGHYVFVTVDGRQSGYSRGLEMEQLSQLFYDLGCKVAFNLDGGQTSVMAFMGKIANKPFRGGRAVSDILYIVDGLAPGETQES